MILYVVVFLTRSYLWSDLPSGPYTGIPWQAGLRRGSALEADGDRIVVREEGFYFVYSQVGWFFCHSITFPHGAAATLSKHTRLPLSKQKGVFGLNKKLFFDLDKKYNKNDKMLNVNV